MKYLIESVKVGEEKKWSKNNKSGTYYNVGLKIKGEWYNNNIFDKEFVNELKNSLNKEVNVILFEEEYRGNNEELKGKKFKKFKKPTMTDLMCEHIKLMNSKIKKLESDVKILNERTQNLA